MDGSLRLRPLSLESRYSSSVVRISVARKLSACGALSRCVVVVELSFPGVSDWSMLRDVSASGGGIDCLPMYGDSLVVLGVGGAMSWFHSRGLFRGGAV